MAWYDGISRWIGRTFGGQQRVNRPPSTGPFGEPEPPVSGGIFEPEPSPVEQQPDEYPFDVGSETVDYEDAGIEGASINQYGDVELQDDYGTPHHHSVDEWLNIAKMTTEELYLNREFVVGGALTYDQIDIMRKLEEMGLINEQDWDDWRASIESDGEGGFVAASPAAA